MGSVERVLVLLLLRVMLVSLQLLLLRAVAAVFALPAKTKYMAAEVLGA